VPEPPADPLAPDPPPPPDVQQPGSAPQQTPPPQECPRCARHRAEKNLQKANRLKRRLDAGLCVQCGKNPITPGGVRCDECLKAKRDSRHAKGRGHDWHPGGRGHPPLSARKVVGSPRG